MTAIVRLLLLTLLCVALPFHAAYGVGMMQSIALGNVDGQRAQGAGAHEGHAHATRVHERHADHGRAAHVHHAPDDDASQTDPGTHCGTCTACCTSLGMTGALLRLPAAQNFGERIASGERRLSSLPVVPLERPPLFL